MTGSVLQWSVTLATAVCTLVLSSCDRRAAGGDTINSDSAVTDEIRECYRRSNEAKLELLQTLGSEELEAILAGKSSADFVIAIRRRHELICLDEATCLGIVESKRGLYLRSCLSRAEDNR